VTARTPGLEGGDPTERMPPGRLRAHQWRRFRVMAAELLDPGHGNPFVKRKWHGAGVDSVEDLRDWDDFRRLPFSSKAELVADQALDPPSVDLRRPVLPELRAQRAADLADRRVRRRRLH
jgi:phenylacetate-coenzyme A ligase PaaK-like adenylate-forming protein